MSSDLDERAQLAARVRAATWDEALALVIHRMEALRKYRLARNTYVPAITQELHVLAETFRLRREHSLLP